MFPLKGLRAELCLIVCQESEIVPEDGNANIVHRNSSSPCPEVDSQGTVLVLRLLRQQRHKLRGFLPK